MQRIEGQLAYVLHSVPYKETSALVHLFTAQSGRMTLMARGAKRARAKGAQLQPLVAWHVWGQGRGEMLTLTGHQAARYWPRPQTHAVWVSCLYVNELLMRLLWVGDAQPNLFLEYETVLEHLLSGRSIEITLRLFEKRLLKALGYALSLTLDKRTGEGVDSLRWYAFAPSVGGPSRVTHEQPGTVSGESLLALHEERLETERHLRDAKCIMRQALRTHLGDKPLHSKRLWLSKEKQT